MAMHPPIQRSKYTVVRPLLDSSAPVGVVVWCPSMPNLGVMASTIDVDKIGRLCVACDCGDQVNVLLHTSSGFAPTLCDGDVASCVRECSVDDSPLAEPVDE